MKDLKAAVMISGCLLGLRCRYDGKDSLSPDVTRLAEKVRFIPFCPEQLGGLPTPRPPAEITGGDGKDVLLGKATVVNQEGRDVTDAYIRGAEASLKLAGLAGARFVIAKERSPSCGLSTPYCEAAGGNGPGVTAALFHMHGIRIFEPKADESFFEKHLMEIVNEGL